MITVGIDEAGRGCWAGPLVAAAVVLKEPVDGLADSKTLTRKKRQELARLIYVKAEVGIGWVSAADIDKIGLTEAVVQAMKTALNQIEIDYDVVIIDGNFNYIADNAKVRTMIKADALIQEVSAASIIAKVARDNYMIEASQKFPEYKFDLHVGYGTALHHSLLKIYGACELHRLSYKPVKALS